MASKFNSPKTSKNVSLINWLIWSNKQSAFVIVAAPSYRAAVSTMK